MNNSTCPNCNYQNLPGTRDCKNCGVTLERRAVIMRPDDVIIANRQLPSRQLKRLGASLAVSAATLLLEFGIIYMRHRLGYVARPSLIPRRQTKLPATLETQSKKTVRTGKRVVSVYSERVVEERRWGKTVRRIVNRTAWRSEESIES